MLRHKSVSPLGEKARVIEREQHTRQNRFHLMLDPLLRGRGWMEMEEEQYAQRNSLCLYYSSRPHICRLARTALSQRIMFSNTILGPIPRWVGALHAHVIAELRQECGGRIGMIRDLGMALICGEGMVVRGWHTVS